MKIYGAGMAGLLTANMMRRYEPIIHELQSELPNNHAALLRFRSDKVSQVTGIPFKQIKVSKGIVIQNELRNESNIDANNRYSLKVTGRILQRSSINLEDSIRYIAPSDFISQCARSCQFKFGSGLTKNDCRVNNPDPIISTIPMPTLMDIVGWPDEERPSFEYMPIWTFTAIISNPCDVYQTIYFPDHSRSYYRASITGDKFIVEFIREIDEPIVRSVAYDIAYDFFGLRGYVDISTVLLGGELKYQHYGKLQPIDEEKRRNFIIAMTDQYNIYSLGRFATWRQLLMDDVVDDIKTISKFIENKTAYERMMTIYNKGEK